MTWPDAFLIQMTEVTLRSNEERYSRVPSKQVAVLGLEL